MARSKLNIYRVDEYVLSCDRQPGSTMEDRQFLDGFSLFLLKPLTHSGHSRLTGLAMKRFVKPDDLAQDAEIVTTYLIECIKEIRDYYYLAPKKDSKGELLRDATGAVIVEQVQMKWAADTPRAVRESLLDCMEHGHKTELFLRILATNSFDDEAKKNSTEPPTTGSSTSASDLPAASA